MCRVFSSGQSTVGLIGIVTTIIDAITHDTEVHTVPIITDMLMPVTEFGFI